MQVEVIVFEDYEVIREKRIGADFIFPVGKPRRKTLYDNDIKKAFNRFINIKTNKDAIRFARKYGLLNDFRIWFTLSTSKIEDNFKLVYGYRSGIGYIDLPNVCDMTITTMQNMMVGFKLPKEKIIRGFKEKIIHRFVGLPEKEVFFKDITKEIGVRLMEYVKYIESKFYEDPENGSIFGIIGEFLNLSDYQSGGSGWRKYISDLANKAKAFLQKDNIEFDNTDEKIDEVLKDYIDRPIEKNIKLQYTIRKARKQGKINKKYFIKTDMVFNSLLDAFDTLWFTAGGILKRCPVCGEIFIAKKTTATYCSAKCRKQAQRDREKGIIKQ